MKNVKTMLLGIAFLLIASMGVPLWLAGAAIGAAMFSLGLLIGSFFCLKGFFAKDE